MTTCKKCGAQKRRWPRSCSRCRSGADRTSDAVDVAANTVDMAVASGALGWIGRAIAGVVRTVLRTLN